MSDAAATAEAAEFGLEALFVSRSRSWRHDPSLEQRIQTIMPGFIVASPSMFRRDRQDLQDQDKRRNGVDNRRVGDRKGTCRKAYTQSVRQTACNLLPFTVLRAKEIIDSQPLRNTDEAHSQGDNQLSRDSLRLLTAALFFSMKSATCYWRCSQADAIPRRGRDSASRRTKPFE